MAVARYRWPMKGWAPEVEAAGGAAFGEINIRETTLNPGTFKENGPFYRGHLAGGVGFSWAENSSVHFLLGYGYNQLTAQSYISGTTMDVEQRTSMSGVFSKAYLKFYF